MRQRRRIEPLSDYGCVIRYHSGKANVVTDALSMKDKEPIRKGNIGAEGFRGEGEPFEVRSDGTGYSLKDKNEAKLDKLSTERKSMKT
ncbi:hypothetical protein Tco_0370541 [Tanacetum coccineum]